MWIGSTEFDWQRTAVHYIPPIASKYYMKHSACHYDCKWISKFQQVLKSTLHVI